MTDPTPTPLTDAEREALDAVLHPWDYTPGVQRPLVIAEMGRLLAAARADERDRIITTAQVERDVARAEVAALRGLLSEATAHETEPCRLDHNGDCQEHGYHDGPCLIPRARAALTNGGDHA